MLAIELVAQGLIQGSIYALVALGLTLVYGLLRILHVAHAALFTLGGYVGVLVCNASDSSHGPRTPTRISLCSVILASPSLSHAALTVTASLAAALGTKSPCCEYALSTCENAALPAFAPVVAPVPAA